MPLAPTGAIIVHVELFGPLASRNISMALDTGADITMIPLETALAVGYDVDSTTRQIEIFTASGMEVVPQLTTNAIHCLGYTVTGLDVLCHNLPTRSPVMGLLGLNFLRRFNVHLDFLFRSLDLHRPALR